MHCITIHTIRKIFKLEYFDDFFPRSLVCLFALLACILLRCLLLWFLSFCFRFFFLFLSTETISFVTGLQRNIYFWKMRLAGESHCWPLQHNTPADIPSKQHIHNYSKICVAAQKICCRLFWRAVRGMAKIAIEAIIIHLSAACFIETTNNSPYWAWLSYSIQRKTTRQCWNATQSSSNAYFHAK